jgi:hypothetical protein
MCQIGWWEQPIAPIVFSKKPMRLADEEYGLVTVFFKELWRVQEDS